MPLPENIDTTYSDDAGDSSVKTHQQHHDNLHAQFNDFEGTTPASFESAGAVAAHEADSTAVHGIADTSALIVEGDARLTDNRDPNAHTHVEADVSDLGTYPDATGVAVGEAPVSDGASGWDYRRALVVDSVTGDYEVTSGLNLNLNTREVIDARLRRYREMGTTPFPLTVIDFNEGTWQDFVITSNTTVTGFSNSPASLSREIKTVTLVLEFNGTYTVTLPSSIMWDGGTAPDLSGVSGTRMIVTIVASGNKGLEYFGFVGGLDFS